MNGRIARCTECGLDSNETVVQPFWTIVHPISECDHTETVFNGFRLANFSLSKNDLKMYMPDTNYSEHKKIDIRYLGYYLKWHPMECYYHAVENFDFKLADIALFSAGGAISAEYAPKAGESSCVVIDNTSHFRYDDDIPLIIPEVNSCKLGEYKNRNIIANANCSTIQLVLALKPVSYTHLTLPTKA